MLREREHGDTDVAEDEVLSQEVEHLEQLFRPLLRLQGEVVECVMSLEDDTPRSRCVPWAISKKKFDLYLKYSAEEDRDNARHLADLCDQVAAVAE